MAIFFHEETYFILNPLIFIFVLQKRSGNTRPFIPRSSSAIVSPRIYVPDHVTGSVVVVVVLGPSDYY